MEKSFLGKAIVAGLLTFSCAQPIWAQEGVDEPFTNDRTLAEAQRNSVDGKIIVNADLINNPIKGILVSGESIVGNNNSIKLDINGFGVSSDTMKESIAIGIKRYSLYPRAGLEVNFVDASNNIRDLAVTGMEIVDGSDITAEGAVIINVSGKTSNTMSGLFLHTADYARSEARFFGPTTINVTNGAIGQMTSGIVAQGSSKVIGTREFNVNVFAEGEAIGVVLTGSGQYGPSEMFQGEKVKIQVNSKKSDVIGIKTDNTGYLESTSSLDILAHTDSSEKLATALLAENKGAMKLGRINIAATMGDGKLGRAIVAETESKITTYREQHNIIGDIIASSKGTIDIQAIRQSHIKGGVTETLFNTSGNGINDGLINIALDEDSVWELTKKSDLTNLVNKKSTLDMRADGNKFGSLQVKNLSGENGIIKMDVDARHNSNNSDKIFVTDNFSGTQYLDLYEKNNYTPVGAEGAGTVLASVKAGDGKFLAQDGEGTLYWKRYELAEKATADTSGKYTTDWYLKGIANTETPTTSVKAIRSAVNYHTWRNENDKLLKRMGELRLNGEDVEGLWVRMQGAKIGRDGNFGFENQYKSYELGYDKKVVDNEKLTRYQGAAFTYTDGKSSYKDGNGDNSSKSLSFYSTDIGAKGHYLDLVFKVSDMDNDFKVYDRYDQKITGDMNNIGVSMSAEYGRKNDLSSGWYIEPQAQFTLGYLGGDSYTTSNGIKVDQSGIKSAVGRVGFNIGKEVGKQGIIYAKANLLHEFGGSYDVNMREGVETLKTSDGFNDTWVEYGIGAAFATSKTGQVYFDVERSTGSDFKKDWQWNIGARWTF